MKARDVILAAGLSLAVITTASAQAPPMDMSWGLRSQMNLWNQGNAAAAAVGQQCYQYLLALRARGYYGPADCGANAQTLQQSINRLDQAQQQYNAAQMYNSWRRSNAVNNWDYGAIRGQYPYPNCWYYGRWVC